MSDKPAENSLLLPRGLPNPLKFRQNFPMADREHTLFLLDGMALVYRAHFAFATNPIRTAAGRNTSAIYGFTNTLLELLTKQAPTHLAVVFDTAAPTARHIAFPAYKAQREEMPEELSDAIPDVKRLIRAFNLPVLELDGYEADDIIGTLAREACAQDFVTFMVTPDKDFGQLVNECTKIYRPGRMGDGAEILGQAEILAKWEIKNCDQVRDILGFMGDASDNIPGIPGVGPKTAQKLIAQYDTLENALDHFAEQKGKLKESLEKFRDQALLSKRLATIDVNVPLPFEPEKLRVGPRDEPTLKALLAEFEFNAIGRRLFGEDFKAGRCGVSAVAAAGPAAVPSSEVDVDLRATGSENIAKSKDETAAAAPSPGGRRLPENPPIPPVPVALRTIDDVKPDYRHAPTLADFIAGEFDKMAKLESLGIAFDLVPGLTPTFRGVAFCTAPGEAAYFPLIDIFEDEVEAAFSPHFNLLFTSPNLTLVGHDLKPGLRTWLRAVGKLDLAQLRPAHEPAGRRRSSPREKERVHRTVEVREYQGWQKTSQRAARRILCRRTCQRETAGRFYHNIRYSVGAFHRFSRSSSFP